MNFVSLYILLTTFDTDKCLCVTMLHLILSDHDEGG